MAANLTRLQVITEVANQVGRKLSSTKADRSTTFQSVLEERYEWAQLRIARGYSFRELDSQDKTTADTVNGTSDYSYSTLFGASTLVKDILSFIIEDGTSSIKLIRKLYRQFDKQWPASSEFSNSKPVWYMDFNKTVTLYPEPSAADDIHTRISKWPTRATGDSTKSDFEDKDDLLVIGVTVEAFKTIQEFKDASRWDIDFRSKFKEAVQPFIHPKDWEPEGRAFGSDLVNVGDFWKQPLQFGNPWSVI